MKTETEIRNEINEEISNYHGTGDPLIKAIYTDRRQTLEWVIGD